jgi:methyl-accepting chemotaxis protein
MAIKSAEYAKEGGAAVSQTVEAMRLIAAKTAIIEEIARSTNMLSLNPSIEAAVAPASTARVRRRRLRSRQARRAESK